MHKLGNSNPVDLQISRTAACYGQETESSCAALPISGAQELGTRVCVCVCVCVLSVCVCVCVCVCTGGGGDAILERKTCMGLRAACFEKWGGVPADEPPHLTVGGERAPLCVCVCVHAHIYATK